MMKDGGVRTFSNSFFLASILPAPQTPPRYQTSSCAGFLWADSSNTKNNNTSLREKSYCDSDVRSDTVSDLSLTLTPEESSVFSKTGILPSTGGSSSLTTAADFSEGGSGARGSRSGKGGSGFLHDRCSLCLYCFKTCFYIIISSIVGIQIDIFDISEACPFFTLFFRSVPLVTIRGISG